MGLTPNSQSFNQPQLTIDLLIKKKSKTIEAGRGLSSFERSQEQLKAKGVGGINWKLMKAISLRRGASGS